MKTKSVLLVCVFALFFMGCDTEPVNEAETLENPQLSERGGDRPFKVRVSGSFGLVESDICAPLAQFAIEGIGNGTHIGRFNVQITECNDFEGTMIQNGIITAANGDELYFSSINFGADADGTFTEYDFEDGTGRFEDSNGYLKLYTVVEFTSQTSGTFSNRGEGFLNY